MQRSCVSAVVASLPVDVFHALYLELCTCSLNTDLPQIYSYVHDLFFFYVSNCCPRRQ